MEVGEASDSSSAARSFSVGSSSRSDAVFRSSSQEERKPPSEARGSPEVPAEVEAEPLQSAQGVHRASQRSELQPHEMYWHDNRVELNEFQTLTLGPFHGGVVCEIIDAWYGVPGDEGRRYDVTVELRQRYNSEENSLSVSAFNKLFGDPAPMQFKTLVVEYRLGLSKPWDISRGEYAEGMRKLGLVPGILTKVVTNVVGATAATAGYTVGKVAASVKQLTKPDEEIRVADSPAFQLGFQTWLTLNGIFPSITYEDGPDDPQNMRQAPLIVSNHLSYIDGFVLAACFGAPKILAMKGTCKMPLVGRFADEIGVIEVDRDDPNSRQHALEAIQTHVAGWKPGDQAMLLFPEGQCSNGDSLLPFKKGAFTPGAVVRPVVVTYTGSWHPSNTNFKETVTGELVPTDDTEWFAQFFGNFMHSLQVKVLRPYSPTEDEMDTPQLFADNVRQKMCTAYEELKSEVQQRREERERNSMLAVAGQTMQSMREAPGQLMDMAQNLWPHREAPDRPPVTASATEPTSRYAPRWRRSAEFDYKPARRRTVKAAAASSSTHSPSAPSATEGFSESIAKEVAGWPDTF